VILSSEAVAQDVIASLHARGELDRVFSNLQDVVQVLNASATSARIKAAEQARLATAVRDGNDLVAQAYERIRMTLEACAEEIALRAHAFDNLTLAVADLQIEAPMATLPGGTLPAGGLSEDPRPSSAA
jgi:hypothetical protein